MSAALKTIIYPVRDLAKAKELFGALLGVPPMADQPYYVGYAVGDEHVGLDPNGHGRGMTGPVPYWHVDDIRGHLKLLVDAGAQTVQDVTEVGGGRLIASVRDADGNPIGLIQDA